MRAARCGGVAAVVVACALATPVQAQERAAEARVPAAEIGMEPAVLVRVSEGSSSSTLLALPGGSYAYFSMLYASLFVTPQFALEPSLMYQHHSSEFGSGWFAVGTLRAAGYQGAQANSAYAFLETGFSDSNGSNSGLHDLGAGAGYRWLVAEKHVALRLEGFYRRWSGSPSETHVGLALRAGVVIPRAR